MPIIAARLEPQVLARVLARVRMLHRIPLIYNDLTFSFGFSANSSHTRAKMR